MSYELRPRTPLPTPGPYRSGWATNKDEILAWLSAEPGDRLVCVATLDSTDGEGFHKTLAIMCGTQHEDHDNAKQFAAVPDLLEALKRLVSHVHDSVHDHDVNERWAAVAEAEKAIAKATGGTE